MDAGVRLQRNAAEKSHNARASRTANLKPEQIGKHCAQNGREESSDPVYLAAGSKRARGHEHGRSRDGQAKLFDEHGHEEKPRAVADQEGKDVAHGSLFLVQLTAMS